ncbi:hypothetical protein J7M28_01700 [bacterium]|nr:hypothetical protein [bacterium]
MKFVKKYTVDFEDQEEGVCPLPTEDTKKRVRRSVNGFIMETYCELLGRRCTRDEMQRCLDEWPMVEAFTGLAVKPDEQVVAGNQRPLCNKGTSIGHLSQRIEAREKQLDAIPDPDRQKRYRLRSSIMLTDEYLKSNLKRMIINVLNRTIMDGYAIGASGWELVDELIRRYLARYRDAMIHDLLPLEAYQDPDTVTLNQRALFGRQLYSELCQEFDLDPMVKWTSSTKLVSAFMYSWYEFMPIPGPGPFDIWAPHPHVKLPHVDWERYSGANAWGEISGSLHGIWELQGKDAEDFLEQNFTDAVEAGIDFLTFMTWIRPGATVYPWHTEGGCENTDWWSCKGGDDMGLRWLRLAVQVLNKMKQDGKPTPKLALGIETPQLCAYFSKDNGRLNWTNPRMDPLHWASCAVWDWSRRGYTAEWGPDADPTASDNFSWPLIFTEAQRHLASMLRTMLQIVPLEHLAFIEGRPVFYIWMTSPGIQPAQELSSWPAKNVSRLFSQEFYGFHTWAMAEPSWNAHQSTPEGNDFVYWEPADPYDANSEDMRVGDVVIWSEASSSPQGPGISAPHATALSLGPGDDATVKTWTLGTNKGNIGKYLNCIAQRNSGMLYFDNWLSVLVAVGLMHKAHQIPFNSDLRAAEIMDPPIPVYRVFITTWNELYEGTGVCRSREWDDVYIGITSLFSDIWHKWKVPTHMDTIRSLVYTAFTGCKLPMTTRIGEKAKGTENSRRPSWQGEWHEVAVEVINLREAASRHPPQVLAAGSGILHMLPAIDQIRPKCAENAEWFLPLDISCMGTGTLVNKTAYLWLKFYPANPKDEWRVFTNPEFGWVPDVDEGGLEAWCRLVEVHRVDQSSGIPIYYGCIIDRKDPSENDPRPNALYQYDDRMRRPWTTVMLNSYPNLFPFEVPEFDVRLFMILNLVVDDYVNSGDAVIHAGGTILESGDLGGTSSWVSLQSSLNKVSLSFSALTRRPVGIQAGGLPERVAIMLPKKIPAALGVNCTQRRCTK